MRWLWLRTIFISLYLYNLSREIIFFIYFWFSMNLISKQMRQDEWCVHSSCAYISNKVRRRNESDSERPNGGYYWGRGMTSFPLSRRFLQCTYFPWSFVLKMLQGTRCYLCFWGWHNISCLFFGRSSFNYMHNFPITYHTLSFLGAKYIFYRLLRQLIWLLGHSEFWMINFRKNFLRTK